MRTGLIAAALLTVGGCAPAAMSTSAPVMAVVATAALSDESGLPKGRIAIVDVGDKLRLTLDARDLPPGPLAFHVHAIGKCEAPGFTSAGPHWNPTGRQHGRDNPMGAHAGDMMNIAVGANGRATATADLAGTLAQLLDADGASVVIHAQADDYRTDPAGSAGARIACGVITGS